MSGGMDREHAASPRRRKDARQQGRVPNSREFVFAIVFAASSVTLAAFGPLWFARFQESLKTTFVSAGKPLADPVARLQQETVQFGWMVLPFVVVTAMAVVIAHWVQHGPLWLPSRPQPDVSRLNPATGLLRLVRAGTLADVLMAIAKIGVLLSLGVWLVRQQWPSWVQLGSLDSARLGTTAGRLLLRYGAYLGTTLIVWGGIDLAWHLFQHERKLKMTPDELRDEVKAVHNDVLDVARRRQSRGS